MRSGLSFRGYGKEYPACSRHQADWEEELDLLFYVRVLHNGDVDEYRNIGKLMQPMLERKIYQDYHNAMINNVKFNDPLRTQEPSRSADVRPYNVFRPDEEEPQRTSFGSRSSGNSSGSRNDSTSRTPRMNNRDDVTTRELRYRYSDKKNR